MSLIDTGIRHNHRLKGHLYTFWRVNQLVDTYNAPAATGTNSQTCRKVTSWDLLTYYDPVGRVRLNVNGQFSNVLELQVDLAESGTHGLHDYLRLSVVCRLPGYSLDLPTGAVADSASAFHLDTEGQDFDVELAFTSYTYFDNATLGYSERIEGTPTLTIGSLVVTFTRTAAPTASGDIQDTYHCSRRASVPGTGDSGVLTLPLTSQPQAFLPKDEFGPHGDNLDIGVWHYDITALPDELVRVDELAWEIDESGWPDPTPVLANLTFAFAAGSTVPDRVKEPATATCPTDLTFRTCAFTGGTERDATIGTVTSTLLKIEKNGDLSHQASWQLSDFFPITCWTECANPPGTLSPRHVACRIFDNVHFGSFLIEAPSQTLWQNFYRDEGAAQTSTNAQVIGSPPHYPSPSGADGVDLAVTSQGWLFATYHEGADVKLQCSRDAGASWDAAWTIASDASAEAAPSLCVDPWDVIFVAYHTDAPATKIWRVPDYGEGSPILQGTHAAYLFPKPAWFGDRLLVALMDPDHVAVYESSDFGATLTLDAPFGTHPQQRPVLLVEERRQPVAHLFYTDSGGALIHRFSASPETLGTWNNAVNLVGSGASFPGSGAGTRTGLVSWFEGDTLRIWLLGSNLSELDRVAASPTADFLPSWPGIVWDWHEEPWFLCRAASAGNALLPCYSNDEGDAWTIVAGAGL